MNKNVRESWRSGGDFKMKDARMQGTNNNAQLAHCRSLGTQRANAATDSPNYAIMTGKDSITYR